MLLQRDDTSYTKGNGMPLSFHTRLTDEQVRAIDAATQVPDPRTGLHLSVSRQEVVSAVLDAWIAAHAQPSADSPRGVEPTEGASTQLHDSPLVSHKEADRETPPLDSRRGPQVSASKLALAERVRELRKTKSHRQIVEMFTAEGVPTVGPNPGAKWSNSAIERLEKCGLQDGD